MPSAYNADLKPILPGTSTHPYDHATKLFLSDNFRLAPKQSFLYYVCINVDTTAIGLDTVLASLFAPDGISSQTLIEQYETGLLAKRVELPKFNLNTKTFNAYNRKNIVQTGLTYEPLNITFHDDSADVVTNFWNDYYTYYYRDSDYTETLYQMPHKYQPRLRDGWGYGPRNNSIKPFLRNIQIFSLHNKRFTEYLLVNPYITGWRHGEHNSASGNELLENQMTVAYESVKYRTGYVNAVDVNGFAVLHYDNYNSPIATSTTNIYSDAGLVGALAGGSRDLARPDGTGSGTGVLGNILNAYRLFNNSKGVNFNSLAKVAVGQIAGQVINGAINGAINNVFFPTTATAGTVYGSTQVYNNTGAVSLYNPYANPTNSLGTSIAGAASGIVAGAAINSTSAAVNNWSRGLVTTQYGAPAGVSSSTAYQVQTSNNGTVQVQVNADGQPVTAQTTALVYNQDGVVVARQTVVGDQTGTYYPSDINRNLKQTSSYTDSDGALMSVYAYNDGTTVIKDESGNDRQVYPGSNYGKTVVPVSATSTRTIAQTGQVIGQNTVQTYTDPRTGITYAVGGTGAQITNAISGTVGLAAGGYVGQGVYSALSSTALGKTVIGQAVSLGLGSATGAIVGRAVNNGLQPIIGGITNSIAQGWDSFTGSIKNVVGSWTGSGKYDPTKSTENIVTWVPDGEGGRIITDKAGGTAFVDSDGKLVSYVNPTSDSSNTTLWPQIAGTTPGINSDSSAIGGSILTDARGNPVSDGYGSYWNNAGTATASSGVPVNETNFGGSNLPVYTPSGDSTAWDATNIPSGDEFSPIFFTDTTA